MLMGCEAGLRNLAGLSGRGAHRSADQVRVLPPLLFSLACRKASAKAPPPDCSAPLRIAGFFPFEAASAIVELVSVGPRAPVNLLTNIAANGATAFMVKLAMTFRLILQVHEGNRRLA
jgi:hypothetical protein